MWKYDTKMHLKGTGQEGVGKNHLTEDGDRWWNIVNIWMEKLKVFLNTKKFFTCWATVSFSRDLVCVTEWQVDRLIGSFFLW
jgi:hypothetical protein